MAKLSLTQLSNRARQLRTLLVAAERRRVDWYSEKLQEEFSTILTELNKYETKKKCLPRRKNSKSVLVKK